MARGEVLVEATGNISKTAKEVDMSTFSRNHWFVWLIFASVLLGGCATRTRVYRLQYSVKGPDIVQSDSVVSMKVQVARFYDIRDDIEQRISDRKESGGRDLKDYTYDAGFGDKVAEQITRMVIRHLNQSKVFSPHVTLARITSEQLTDAMLENLAKEGVDAVVTGEIEHFYGYYDHKPARRFLYAFPLGMASMAITAVYTAAATGVAWVAVAYPGAYLGYYLESLHPRNIERHVLLKVQLISTKTHKPLWEDTFHVQSSERRSMPGFATRNRKYHVAVNSLRDATNEMVMSLRKADLGRAISGQLDE